MPDASEPGFQPSRDTRALLSLLLSAPFPGNGNWTSMERQAAIALLWRDLQSKHPDMSGLIGGLQLSNREVEFSQDWNGHPATAQGNMQGAREAQEGSSKSSPKIVDVLLICPLPKEAFAALVAFDGSPFEKEDLNLDGRKVWFKVVERGDVGRPLQVAIAVIAKQRNVQSAIATMVFANKIKSEAAFLCGIGGGVKEKVHLGDVVVSKSVIDIAGGREELDGVRPRFDPIGLPEATERQLKFFVDSRVEAETWKSEILAGAESLATYKIPKMPTLDELRSAPLLVDDGIIVAGERLKADGTLPDYLSTDDRIRSCEMEGSGFAQSCRDRRMEWAVFRGISDYGDPEKTDIWQAIAAFAAVRAAREFLATEFRLREEMAETSF